MLFSMKDAQCYYDFLCVPSCDPSASGAIKQPDVSGGLSSSGSSGGSMVRTCFILFDQITSSLLLLCGCCALLRCLPHYCTCIVFLLCAFMSRVPSNAAQKAD